MPYSIEALKAANDRDYPTNTSFGYAALLDDALATNLTYTVNFSTDTLTTSAPHGLVTGTRVRSTATVAQPGITPSGTLNGAADYFVQVTSNTQLKLHLSLDDAINGNNEINFTDAGSGVLQLNEQELKADDAIEVLINHELDHPDYFRKEVVGAGSSTFTNGEASKTSSAWTITANTPNPAIVFGYVLTIKSGGSSVGDTGGSVDFLDVLSSTITIAAGTSKSYIQRFATANV